MRGRAAARAPTSTPRASSQTRASPAQTTARAAAAAGRCRCVPGGVEVYAWNVQLAGACRGPAGAHGQLRRMPMW